MLLDARYSMLATPSRGGFTLVEVIIYVGIFAMLGVFVAGALWNLSSGAAANRARVSVDTEADFVMRKMSWASAGAISIEEPAVGATSSRLSFSKFNFAENPITFEVASGTLVMSRGSGLGARLLSGNVRVVSFTVHHVPEVVGEPESATITLVIAASSSDPGIRASTTLKTNLYLRK